MKNLFWSLLALALMATGANAQTRVKPCFQTGTNVNSCQDVTSANPLPVNASVTASISGFTAASTGTPISVTTGGVSGTLPAGAVVVATNAGATNTAYCALGASATTSSQPIPPGGWFAFTVGVSTQLTCITSTSTTIVNMTGGAGLPTGTGGGGGSGGGVVTQPTASLLNMTEANSASILSAVQGAIPAGANVIGGVTEADGADVTAGAKADARSTATDTTPVTAQSVRKQISQSVQLLVSALGSTALDLGFGTGGTRTLRVAPDTGFAANVTPTDCSGTITSGGTAQNAFTAQTTLHGFTIVNIDTTEPMWISFTTTAAASGAGSYPLQAATATTFASPGSFTTPRGFGLNHALSVIATTTSHKFTCTWW